MMLVAITLAVVAVLAVAIMKRSPVIPEVRVVEARFKGQSLVVKLEVDREKFQRITKAFVHPHTDAFRMYLLKYVGPSRGTTKMIGISTQQVAPRLTHHTIEFNQVDAISSEEKKMINSLELIGTRPDGSDFRYEVDFELVQ